MNIEGFWQQEPRRRNRGRGESAVENGSSYQILEKRQSMEINKIKQLLERQGFQPNIDKDGDMLFKFEGGDYYITIDKRDTNFIAIICPFFSKNP